MYLSALVTTSTTACFAFLALAAHDHHETGESNENVDETLKPAYAAKNEIDNIPVASVCEETSEPDKPPVNGTDEHEPPAQCCHATFTL